MTHFRVWYSLHIAIIHLIISLIYFICLLIDTMFTLDTIGSMAHGIHYTCCISYMRAWVLIIGYLSLVSLRFYHPITLAYVTSRVLRPPWGHGIRYRLLRLLCRQVFEIRLTSRYFAMHLLLGDTSRMFRSVSTMFGLPGSCVWWGMIRCHLFFLICRTSDAILGHIPFQVMFMDLHRGHMFDDIWFHVARFLTCRASDAHTGAYFRFDWDLQIFAEVTCSRIDDSMLSDLRPIIHFDAIQGHIYVRMRFTDHERVVCSSLFARRTPRWWSIRYPHDVSLVQPILSYFARPALLDA